MPTAPPALPSHLQQLTSADGASIRVSLFGGHLCSWQTAEGDERLFMSRATFWDGSAALRGGVPVIFPQFGAMGELPKHGFARTLPWTLEETTRSDNGDGVMRLALHHGVQTAAFAARFRLQLTIRFNAEALNIDLNIDNLGTQAFAFTAALHSYFRVDLMASRLLGLQDVRYNDSAAGGVPRRESAAPIQVSSEVDRNYLQVTRPLELFDGRTKMTISQQGFEDVVVWNPWRDKAAALRDLADDEYLQFLCIEAAQVNRAVALPPGQRWTGQQHVIVAAT